MIGRLGGLPHTILVDCGERDGFVTLQAPFLVVIPCVPRWNGSYPASPWNSFATWKGLVAGLEHRRAFHP